MAGHEARLVSDGHITLLDGRKLTLDGREIEKIGINLFDHGSMQSRDVTKQIIEILVNNKLSSDDPREREFLKKVNNLLEKFANSVRIIVDADEQDCEENWSLHKFEMATWWLSIDQLYYVCETGGGLWEGLLPIRHFTRRSGDLVYESMCARALGPNSNAVTEYAKRTDSQVIV